MYLWTCGSLSPQKSLAPQIANPQITNTQITIPKLKKIRPENRKSASCHIFARSANLADRPPLSFFIYVIDKFFCLVTVAGGSSGERSPPRLHARRVQGIQTTTSQQNKGVMSSLQYT
jgi:hypothetical protein